MPASLGAKELLGGRVSLRAPLVPLLSLRVGRSSCARVEPGRAGRRDRRASRPRTDGSGVPGVQAWWRRQRRWARGGRCGCGLRAQPPRRDAHGEQTHGQELREAHVLPPPMSGAQQRLTHSESRVQESAQFPSTQKPTPARKLQQSPFRVHAPLTGLHEAPQLDAGAQALPPLTSPEQQPLLHSLLTAQVSAQRPETQNPSPARKAQQSPLALHTPPAPTQLVAVGVARWQLSPDATNPTLHAQRGASPSSTQSPCPEHITPRHLSPQPLTKADTTTITPSSRMVSPEVPHPPATPSPVTETAEVTPRAAAAPGPPSTT